VTSTLEGRTTQRFDDRDPNDDVLEPASTAAARPRIQRSGFAAGWVLLIGPFVLELLAIVRASHLWLVARLPDDAFYYLEIASRLSRGQGFTFDGINATNGFHPFWQFLLIPVAWATGGGDAFIRATLALGLVLCLVSVVLVVRVVARIVGWGAALMGGIVAVHLSLTSWVDGMEEPAVLLACALLLSALAAAAAHPRPKRLVLVGVLCAVVVLARFDLAIVVLIVPLALAWRARSWRTVGWWALGAGAVAVPFGTWWLVRWHHVLTTSATVKSAQLSAAYKQQFGGRFSIGYLDYLTSVAAAYARNVQPWSYLTRPPLGPNVGVTAALTIAVLTLVITGLIAFWTQGRPRIERRWRNPALWAVAVMAVLVLAKAVLDLVEAPLWATKWYSAPQRLFTGFFVGVVLWLGVQWFMKHHRALGTIAISVAAITALPINGSMWRTARVSQRAPYLYAQQMDLAADWVRGHGPPGRYGALDSGLLGFRLDGQRPVINLDGLVNSYEFADLVTRNASLDDRIRNMRIDYFVGRLTATDLERLGCGRVMWSHGRLPYSDTLTPLSVAPVRIVDVRGCQSPAPVARSNGST